MKNLKIVLVSIIVAFSFTSCDVIALTGNPGDDVANGYDYTSTAPVLYGQWTDGSLQGNGATTSHNLWKIVTDNGNTILIKTGQGANKVTTDIQTSRFGQAIVKFTTEPITIKVNGFVQQGVYNVYAGSDSRKQ